MEESNNLERIELFSGPVHIDVEPNAIQQFFMPHIETLETMYWCIWVVVLIVITVKYAILPQIHAKKG